MGDDRKADADRQRPERDDELYPPYVVTAVERRRWRLASGIARAMFDDEPNRWSATRSIYRSDVPTGPERGGRSIS